MKEADTSPQRTEQLSYMALIIALDIAVTLWMSYIAFSKGFESVLPITAFLLLLFPGEAMIPLPGLFDLTTQRVVVLVLCGLYLALGRNKHVGELRDPLPLRIPLACLIVWMLLSSARSVVPAISFKTTFSQYFDFCTIYFIFVRSVRSQELRNRVLAGFVSGMTVCSVFGILENYFDWSVTSLFPIVISRFSDLESGDLRGARMQSTFGHPILFGAALALAVPMALYLITVVDKQLHKVGLWVAVAMMILCIYKTDSRGPWLALGISMMLLLTLGSGQLRKLPAILGLLTVLVLITRPGIRDTILNLYGATLDPDSPQGESYEWRYMLYHIASRELSKDVGRSLWGYGPESFYYLGLTADFMVEGEMHTVKVESCDSAVVELLMDTGYVGLLLVATLLGTAGAYTIYRYFKDSDSNRAVYLTLFANILAFSFLMTNVELFGWGQQSYMLWIVLALIMMPQSPSSELNAKRSRETIQKNSESSSGPVSLNFRARNALCLA